jgi:peptide/nickel transport system ATP-binding protein
LDGEEIYQLNPARWRSRRSTLRYVFQNPDVALHPGMTAGEILIEALRRKGNGQRMLNPEAVQILADAYLLHETWMDRYPGQLSLGQRRRLALARSLANQPQYTLLDEPFSGLDRTSKRLLWRVFQNLHQGGRMAILMVSHDVDSICELCQRILVMRNGLLVEEPKQDENGVWQVHHPYTHSLFKHSETPFTSA